MNLCARREKEGYFSPISTDSFCKLLKRKYTCYNLYFVGSIQIERLEAKKAKG
jgi:hypothetical protein